MVVEGRAALELVAGPGLEPELKREPLKDVFEGRVTGEEDTGATGLRPASTAALGRLIASD